MASTGRPSWPFKGSSNCLFNGFDKLSKAYWKIVVDYFCVCLHSSYGFPWLLLLKRNPTYRQIPSKLPHNHPPKKLAFKWLFTLFKMLFSNFENIWNLKVCCCFYWFVLEAAKALVNSLSKALVKNLASNLVKNPRKFVRQIDGKLVEKQIKNIQHNIPEAFPEYPVRSHWNGSYFFSR